MQWMTASRRAAKYLFPFLLAFAANLFAADARTLAIQKPSGGNRMALVIGNDNYTGVSPLRNARADARAIATALTKAGYRVESKFDLNEKGMKAAFRDFKRSLSGGDEAVFFFAGHGVQLGAANYLLPVDIKGDNEDQVKDEAIPLQRVLEDIQEQKAKFTLAIIDACRDNPFKGSGRSIGGRGLAPTTAATGQMVIFSAGSGQQALDKLGESDRQSNGLFTRVFLKEMQKPGLPVDRVLKNVRQEVASLALSVKHEQVPALYDQALGEFYFFPGNGTQATTPTPAFSQPAVSSASDAGSVELAFWDSIKTSSDPSDFQAYLDKFPNGQFAALAETRVKKKPRPNTLQAMPPPGRQFKDCPSCPEMVELPAGKVEMGSPMSDNERDEHESEPNKVSVQAFAIGKFEITREQYAEFMVASGYRPGDREPQVNQTSGRVDLVPVSGSNGNSCYILNKSDQYDDLSHNNYQNPGFSQTALHPATCVNFDDATAYVRWLSQKTGKNYRLLSEAEWEYAARAGRPGSRSGESADQICEHANVFDRIAGGNLTKAGIPSHPCSDNYIYTSPVGGFQANAFGLHDMLGNVREWTVDCLDQLNPEAPKDGRPKISGDCNIRIVKGGAWVTEPQQTRFSARLGISLEMRFNSNGFRIARAIAP